ncbi:MAG: tetraacyldisaccharide 4'-kinase [Fimbriimonas ginsengisoli]|uniref:Tetraacyldisaccharide 4'-kinase n=1 Tax=Fimbriimonas ginsengisoli TaxID=1005039 RepID=A0A931LU08_FIMGI|nr:tetraacyldisaccharide 4'-kinase [Fimbriimonas ginsengisoli]MBI3721824.1 tetraacyldisaccharide 4'-kinase [Fimbriimonas ginsengisoli]
MRDLLAPASWLYALGWETYEAVYALGLKQPAEPHRPVVCVGSLRVGGSGKTPFVLFLVDLLMASGRRVAVSCSGYGSTASAGSQVAPEGGLSAKRWGDEPAMIRMLRPSIPLIVGRDRVEAARLCRERFPGSVLLLDDGFQHLPLRKHLSILLDPPRPGFCLPAGPYREPRGGRKRADLVLPDRFRVEAHLTGFTTPTGESQPIEALRGSEVGVLCALGNPSGFLNAMEEACLRVVSTRLLPDHDPLDAGNLFEGWPDDRPIAVTCKDWVKLRERPDVAERSILIAYHEVWAEPREEFRKWLLGKLDDLPSQGI